MMGMVLIQVVLWLLFLVAVFKVKHFLADYPLQTPYMLQKGKPNGWALPLATHCFVHASLTFIVVYIFATNTFSISSAAALLIAAKLFLFDFVSHFLMDRVKASPNLLGRFNDTKKPAFWICLGADQLWHGISDLVVIWFLIYMSTTTNL